MLKKLFRRLPPAAQTRLRAARTLAASLSYRGRGRWCPVCERESRKFGSFGIQARDEAMCIYCKALERHRFAWLYFRDHTDLFDGRPKQMLHVAPEPCFESRLRLRLEGGYITADLNDPRAMLKMDITDIEYPADSFDVIYCSHVLEHVPDDRRALHEFRRVLKPDGWAILLVPFTARQTIEDPSITDPAERLRRFGQEDHVRRYGPDYVDRLREAGFAVKVSRVADLYGPADILRMGLTPASGDIHFCTKRA